jgi:hypothetical protein
LRGPERDGAHRVRPPGTLHNNVTDPLATKNAGFCFFKKESLS